jgi:hypothetical protein
VPTFAGRAVHARWSPGVRIHDDAELGGEDHLIPAPGDRFTDEFLVLAHRVDFRGVKIR